MRTEDLIVELARSAGPVRVLRPPLVRLASWMAGAIAIAAVAVVAVGPRADAASAIGRPLFDGLALATIATALAAGAAALRQCVPGIRAPFLWIVPAVAWIALLLVSLASEPQPIAQLSSMPVHAACAMEIAIVALVVSGVLFGMLRRGAPLQPFQNALTAAVAGVSMGAAAAQLICPIDAPAHVLVGHVLPAAAFILLGAALGRRLLRSPALAG